LGEIAGEYLRKGSKVYVEGSLRTRKWQGQDGQDRYTTEIVANEMQMLDSRGSGDSAGGGQYQQQAPKQSAPQQQQQRSAPQQQQQAPQQQYAPQQQPAAPQAAPGGFDDFDDDIPF